MKRTSFISRLVIVMVMIGSNGCGGTGSDNITGPDSDIANNQEAAEALVAMANAEMDGYARLLDMFSAGGTKPLFDSSIELSDEDYETLIEVRDRIEAVLPAYEAAGVFVVQRTTANSRVAYVGGRPRLPQGVVGAVTDFVNWIRGATGERRREDILQIAATLSEADRQQMYQSAQESLPGVDLGADTNEFFTRLTSGDLDSHAARLHSDFAHDSNIPAYIEATQEQGRRPIDIASREGAKGLETGAQVLVEGSKAIICAQYPQFCDGYDKAEEVIDKLNEIGEDPLGSAGDAIQDGLKERAQEWLQDKLKDEFGVEIDFDELADQYEEFSGLVSDVEGVAELLDVDFGGLGALFPGEDVGGEGTSLDDIEILILEGGEGAPVVIALPDGDNATTDIVVPTGDYEVITLGANDDVQTNTVTAPPGNSTIVVVDLENQGDSGGLSLSLSASPADPGPSEGVTVTGRVIPATANVEITFSITGTDGYSNTQTSITDETGVATFFIPGGGEGVVDTVSATIVSTGLMQSFTYTF
ncbi:MAG: hypothetical protein HJJLKODD_02056 [Phycisphaerae bacterium]|nr:hypothetical protein [Phycisphaerae bacterium]